MTATRWKARLSTALSWSSEPAAWPVSATGSSAPIASTAIQPTVFSRVATIAPVATTTTASELISSERSRSIWVMNCPSCSANPGAPGAIPASRA